MVPCVQAHLQVLGENYILAWVFIPVFSIELMDIAPFGRAVFLAGSAVLQTGIVQYDRNSVDTQGTKHEFQGMLCPVQGKRMIH